MTKFGIQKYTKQANLETRISFIRWKCADFPTGWIVTDGLWSMELWSMELWSLKKEVFSNFSYRFLNPRDLNYNCSNLLDLRNLQEQFKKNILFKKLVWSFIVWRNCSDDLNKIANSWPSVSNFEKIVINYQTIFSHSWPEQF